MGWGMIQPLRVLDLFSGIGAFSLGLERSGAGTPVAFCDADPYCRQVLARHWPNIPCFDDIRTLAAADLKARGIKVNAICGGFPCQDISYAGPGAGLRGNRSGLWSEFARLIGELEPDYVLVENVAALLDRGLGDVLGTLSDLGFDAEWSTVSACSLGATHMRRRVFIVAYANGVNGRQGIRNSTPQCDWTVPPVSGFTGARACAQARVEDPSELYRGADDVACGMDRNHAVGNSIYWPIPELIGRAVIAHRAAA